jgi:hypothetical protein
MWNLTGLAGDVTVQSGEDKVTVLELLGRALAQNEVAQLLRHGRGLLPADGILVLLSKRTLGGTDSMELQEGMVRQQQNEALADRTGGTEHT